jgi:Glycosyl transferase family 2
LTGLGPGADRDPCSPPAGLPRVIAGGIVAHNDERRIGRSIRSLLGQRLPPGTEWGRIWVVASGCTDATVEVARTVAEVDPRVALVVEPERRGKAAALGEVLRRAQGESLILLNSDAVAAQGSVDALLSKARDKPRPFAVMGRPKVAPSRSGGWVASLDWMWQLHHELHLEMLSDGTGGHLSDELLLVSLPAFPWIEDGIINDGSYCAVWLQNHAGGCWYAPEAEVSVEVPSTPSDHLKQRRRIHVGNAQVAARLGRPPTTAARYFLDHPFQAVRGVRRALGRGNGIPHLVRVGALELAAHLLAAWDRIPPRRDHVLWGRIRPAPDPPDVDPVPDGEAVERRLRTLRDVAQEFGATLTPERVTELLPASGPTTTGDLETYLCERGESAMLRAGNSTVGSDDRALPESRLERGERYLARARRLWTGPLASVRPWVRCVGVTGSTAYGEPEDGDDLDFFVVTRRGTLALVLGMTYLALRLERLRSGRRSDPPACFNYVVDERRAAAELADGRGLLFAREALTARMIVGDPYYRGLLAHAHNLAAEFPRLYAARTSAPGDARPGPTSIGPRALGALVFLPLAGYLQLVGLARNARARREGRASDVFRTVTRPQRVAFASRRFEQLRELYQRPAASAQAVAAPSRIPTAR